MVGVPGRSQACLTCLRRKKGCDHKRPICTQCQRSGLECAGYKRDRTFVYFMQPYPSSASTNRESSIETGSEVGSEANAPKVARENRRGARTARHVTSNSLAVYRGPPTNCFHQRHLGDTRQTIASGTEASSASSPFSPFSPASSSSSSSSSSSTDYRIVPMCTARTCMTANPQADRTFLASACEENILGAFWQLYLPNSTNFSTQAAGYASGGWTNVVQSLYRQDRVLYYALMANCLSTVARLQGASREMAEQSLCAHGLALQALRQAISLPHKVHSDTVFSALRLMIVFSMFFSDRFEEDRMARAVSWREHNMGMLALIQARGPEAHVNGCGHQMFVDCRLPLIIASLRDRKTSPLNTFQWMTIPWSVIPKTPKDRLIDIMAGLPSILEDIDALEKPPPDSRMSRDARCRRIVSMCWNCDRQLRAWYQASVPLERLYTLEQGVSNGPLSTEDLSLIYGVSIFCTACLMLYSAIIKVGITGLPQNVDLVTYIGKICRYLRFFFHPSAGQYGLEMASFPLGACLQLIEAKKSTMDLAAEKAMIDEIITTDRGREIMDFLRSMMYVKI